MDPPAWVKYRKMVVSETCEIVHDISLWALVTEFNGNLVTVMRIVCVSTTYTGGTQRDGYFLVSEGILKVSEQSWGNFKVVNSKTAPE